MKNSTSRYGSILLAGFAAIWLFAACGSAAGGGNVSGETGHGGGEIESTVDNESSHAQVSGNDANGELNITTSTGGATPTTGTSATSSTTTGSGQTANYTNSFPVTISPASITATTTPAFSWTATPVYKIYVTAANSTTIKWGLKCATGSNCISGPVSLGAQSATGATATPIGTASTGATLAAGAYNVVVEIASATGTISQSGWTAFTVQ